MFAWHRRSVEGRSQHGPPVEIRNETLTSYGASRWAGEAPAPLVPTPAVCTDWKYAFHSAQRRRVPPS